MRTYALSSILLVPVLLTLGQAAQNWSVDQSNQGWVISSEDGGTSSYLGVDIADITTERLSALKLKEEKGVEITMVDQDAPAGKAGIKVHDVILTMNGTSVESEAQLRRMIHEMPPGRVITLGLSRDGQPVTLKVQLADKHREFPRVNVPDIHIPDIHIPNIEMPTLVVVTQTAHSGLMVENLTPQLGEFFGVKDGNGVLVRSVDKGSRAEKAGFHAGDVIVKINDLAVHDTSDFAHAVKSRSGNSISVGVMREKREQKLNLTLPDKDSGNLYLEDSSEQLIHADSAASLGELREEMAKLRTQAMADYRKAAAEYAKSQSSDAKALREQSEKLREQLRKQSEKLRQEWRRDRLRWGTAADL